MANANAAWSTTTKANARFWCVVNCEAGGLGKVADNTMVPSTTDDGQNWSNWTKRVGSWSRTVLIQCKIPDSSGSGAYRVTVQDKNWTGTWVVTQNDLSRAINNTGFPVC